MLNLHYLENSKPLSQLSSKESDKQTGNTPTVVGLMLQSTSSAGKSPQGVNAMFEIKGFEDHVKSRGGGGGDKEGGI
jgi:hypothetical protein